MDWHVVAIRALRRIDVRHQVKDAMALNDAMPNFNGNIVALLNRLGRLDFNVRVDDDQVAHLARAQVMYAHDPRGFDDRLPDILNFLIIC